MMAGAQIEGLAQIALSVADARRATSFYRDTLGLRLLFEAPPALAFFECSGVRIMIAEPETPSEHHASSVLYFRVPDVEAAHASLQRAGVQFESDPHVVHRADDHDLWMAFFHDGEGNMHALIEERRR
jgi:methylmalonyl-CoA/ethylmalonyl-CoA epimerase